MPHAVEILTEQLGLHEEEKHAVNERLQPLIISDLSTKCGFHQTEQSFYLLTVVPHYAVLKLLLIKRVSVSHRRAAGSTAVLPLIAGLSPT